MTRVTETKSVKVDNWGVFFLQKLQNFFNKTDHCDLTLQFNDNSQLKVHRLVLSACTDYFNMLEQTCEMIDDVLIMPLDLQADVIVPIVNFMYTGTLEFQYNMYEKLLKTARDMNMTVLLKLLEAHRQTTARLPRQPVLLNKQAPQQVQRRGFPATSTPFASPSISRSYSSQPSSIRATSTPKPGTGLRPVFKHHQTTIAPLASYTTEKNVTVPEPIQIVTKYAHTTNQSKAGPSRFEVVEETAFEGSFDTISYESKPLVTEIQLKQDEENSPFEKLRKGYTNVNVLKRTAPPQQVVGGPAAKKLNLQDVKEFTEAARMRNKLTTELEDPATDYIEDDTPFNDDDDEEETTSAPNPVKITPPTKTYVSSSTTRQVMIKQSQTSPVKQITVKDDTGNVDHAKIISEVLKKYPHLVKNNKNIKLKIMQKTSPGTPGSNNKKIEIKTSTPLRADMKMVKQAKQDVRVNPTTPVLPKSNPPKKIDAKTMHELIAKGPENMTGPWLCLRCGINGRPISIPSYKAFRNHLVVKHQERIDPRICEHCGWRAERRNPNLFYHWLIEHKIRSSAKFPKCEECDYIALNDSLLNNHMTEAHDADGGLQQCIYCNKCFKEEMELYEHMKSLHKQKAQEDGVCNFSDEDEIEYEVTEKYVPNDPQVGSSKIKVLSNISLPSKGIPFVLDPAAQSVSQIGGASTKIHMALEPSSEAEAMSNVASGIATSLGLVDQSCQYIEDELANVHGEFIVKKSESEPDLMTKLITADGTELELTQLQKDEIISQLQGQSGGENVVMVLNDEAFAAAGGEITMTDNGGQIIDTSSLTGAAQQNIVLMYSDDANQDTNMQMIKMEKDLVDHESVVKTEPESINIKVEKDSEEERKNKEKMKLISELEGDWTEEEEEDAEEQQQIEEGEQDVVNIKTEQMSTEEIPENLLQSQSHNDTKTKDDEAETIPKTAENVTETLDTELEDKNIDAMLKEWNEDDESKNDYSKIEENEEPQVKEENVSAASESQEVVVEEAEESTADDKESQEDGEMAEINEETTVVNEEITEEKEENEEAAEENEEDDDEKVVVAVLEDSEAENKTGDESMETSLVKEDSDDKEMSVENPEKHETNGEKEENEENDAKSKEVTNLLGDWDDDEDL